LDFCATWCPGQGYILYSLRKKLKAELVGRSQEEIKELRLAGQEVTDTYQVRHAGSSACSARHRISAR
jgi:predicted MarR family transcription regulator